MQSIPLKALPSQIFTVSLDGNEWIIGVRSTNGTISVSLNLNGAVVVESVRAVAGEKIIPSKYEETGNFAIITTNFEIPDYIKFGSTQSLIYITQAELDVLRIPKTGIITASDFDPNGALPLRFKPQGYKLAP